MKWLSLNSRGMASLAKKLAFKRLLENEWVGVIFLQETLGLIDLVILVFESLILGWKFHALDIRGQSGGIAFGFNPRVVRILKIWGGVSFIGADIFSSELGKELRLINMYGPCHNKVEFWDPFLSTYLLQADNIILGGDLNFSIGHANSWGTMLKLTLYQTLWKFYWITLSSLTFPWLDLNLLGGTKGLERPCWPEGWTDSSSNNYLLELSLTSDNGLDWGVYLTTLPFILRLLVMFTNQNLPLSLMPLD